MKIGEGRRKVGKLGRDVQLGVSPRRLLRQRKEPRRYACQMHLAARAQAAPDARVQRAQRRRRRPMPAPQARALAPQSCCRSAWARGRHRSGRSPSTARCCARAWCCSPVEKERVSILRSSRDPQSPRGPSHGTGLVGLTSGSSGRRRSRVATVEAHHCRFARAVVQVVRHRRCCPQLSQFQRKLDRGGGS
jgi:hypothetical protein